MVKNKKSPSDFLSEAFFIKKRYFRDSEQQKQKGCRHKSRRLFFNALTVIFPIFGRGEACLSFEKAGKIVYGLKSQGVGDFSDGDAFDA